MRLIALDTASSQLALAAAYVDGGALCDIRMADGPAPRKANQVLLPRLEVPEKKLKMRLWYMYRDKVCTLIDVDDLQRVVEIKNYTDDLLYCAFGVKQHPEYADYLAFLESRCFPASRDKLKLELKERGIPFYDPMLIIEKTEGRMAEDDFWLKIER